MGGPSRVGLGGTGAGVSADGNSGRRWQPFAPGIEVYTRDPAPPPGEPFTGDFDGSAFAEGRWRVYVGEGAEPVAEGWCVGRDGEERMRAARREVERWWGGAGARPLAVDIDVWRAEALDAGRLARKATPAWTQALHIDEPRALVSADDMNRSLLGLDRDGMAIFDRAEDARFAAEARDGWPRDAARVAALCARVTALEEALTEALDLAAEATDTIEAGMSECTAARADIARLRAISAGRKDSK